MVATLNIQSAKELMKLQEDKKEPVEESVSPQASRPLVLVVEDDPDSMNILKIRLEQFEYDVIAFGNAVHALKWLQHGGDPDLVISDWMLPGLSGIDLCREIRKSKTMIALPILILSALGSIAAEKRVEGLLAGANDFMSKPYSKDELQARLAKLLEVRRSAQHTEKILGQYTAQEVLKEARSKPEILDTRAAKYAVVLFADIRKFSEITETAPPENTLAILDAFFETMTPIIQNFGGVVLDFNGDELLAAFNIPYDVPIPTHLAVEAALEMQRAFLDLRLTWAKEYQTVGLGVGIHQGNVVMGNIGSADLKRFTIIGNTVNVAHRLVEMAEEGEIVTTLALYKSVKMKDSSVVSMQSDNVRLRGMTQTQTIIRFKPVS